MSKFRVTRGHSQTYQIQLPLLQSQLAHNRQFCNATTTFLFVYYIEVPQKTKNCIFYHLHWVMFVYTYTNDLPVPVCPFPHSQCCQLSWMIRETPDFGLYLPVSRLQYEISQIIATVCHFFSRLDFPDDNKISAILHCLSYNIFTVNIERFFDINSGMPL